MESVSSNSNPSPLISSTTAAKRGIEWDGLAKKIVREDLGRVEQVGLRLPFEHELF
jgi:hypothetical protein